MDFRDTWKSVSNTFYPIFYAFLLSAVLIWDEGLFKWIQEWQSHTISVIFACSSSILILIYFMIDWFDANVVHKFDKAVTQKDISYWIIKLTLLSIILVFLVHNEHTLILWVAFGYHLLQFVTVLRRDKYADSQQKDLTWQDENDNRYKKTLEVFIYRYIVMVVDFIFTLLLLVLILFPNLFGTSVNTVMLPNITITLSLILNVVLKYLRHIRIFVPLYIHFSKTNINKNE